jgi:hypothetical protein
MSQQEDDSNIALTSESEPDAETSTVGKKRKTPPPTSDTAIKGKQNAFEASAGQPKKKYIYSDEQKRLLRQKHYEALHEIQSFLQTGQYPSNVKGAVDRSNFKRKSSKSILLENVLHKKRKHQPCRVLWENEVFPTLKQVHEK